MDIRGVEITNQLRNAIRAKLLELGVRFDEELPDYILVMVVNKKSRQHMIDDLSLFLEDSTKPFVDWLHDQVLKKLQKVTVAKKKLSKETSVATIEVKQEAAVKVEGLKEEKEDKKNEKKDAVPAKKEKDKDDMEFDELLGDLETLNKSDTTHSYTPTRAEKKLDDLTNKDGDKTNDSMEDDFSLTPPKETKKVLKRSSTGNEEEEKSRSKRSKIIFGSKDSEEEENRKSKPKITSVVAAVKLRPNKGSPEKVRSKVVPLSESREVKSKSSHSSRSLEKRSERRDMSPIPRSSEKRSEKRDGSPVPRVGSIKSRLGSIKLQTEKNTEESKARVSNVKSRLGRKTTVEHELEPRRPMILYDDTFDDVTEDIDDLDMMNSSSLKSAIVPVKKPSSRRSKSRDRSKRKWHETEEIPFDEEGVVEKVLPQKQRGAQSLLLRAVAEANKSVVTKRINDPCLHSKKNVKPPIKIEDIRKKISKKKMESDAKRRMGMEKIKIELRNTNVDSKKSKKPCLNEKEKEEQMDLVKSLFHKTSSKTNPTFLVTLNGYNNNVASSKKQHHHKKSKQKSESESEESEDSEESEEGEVESSEEEEEEEGEIEEGVEEEVEEMEQEVEVEDEEVIFETDPNEVEAVESSRPEKDYETSDSGGSRDERNDNDDDGIETLFVQQKAGKEKEDEKTLAKKKNITPIVFAHSRSNTPEKKVQMLSSVVTPAPQPVESKKPNITSVVTTVQDKSSEKCRYWPSCTLGNQCSFYHPEVPCSTFPACKFGDKCAYVHPKCKFGAACPKFGCKFSHPPLQCKYHPYCMKPGCPYSHPKTVSSLQILEITSQKSKFTWKKHE